MPAVVYDLEKGENPAFLAAPLLPDVARATPADIVAWQAMRLPLAMCTNGHNVIHDTASGVPYAVPVSPCFVRDLSGRVIYTGTGPEAKSATEWLHNPAVTFPRGCHDVTAETVNAEKIEQVFLTEIRTLERAWTADFSQYNDDKTMARVPDYRGLNLYPYKMRPDTFYLDGFRLPQTACLYARTVAAATDVAANFMQQWHQRPEEQTYADFYEKNQGDTWYEQLFLQGVTIIPTFEAANGYNKVGTDYALEDYWPGRAVAGLHEITEERPAAAPPGTILDVKQPGYMTTDAIMPAQVVVSDGSGYQSPLQDAPSPQQPDVRLSHPRTTTRWHQCWLPTHPAHFEAPAIWGWCQQTGQFIQLAGPLWDPLHYTYASTPHILRALRQTPQGQFAHVPEEMQRRFFPIIPQREYETLSVSTMQARQAAGMQLQGSVDRVVLPEPAAGIGYHPLPPFYEFEENPFWRTVEPATPPADVPDNIAPVIKSTVTAHMGSDNFVTLDENPPPDLFQDATGEALTDYPHLTRYFPPNTLPFPAYCPLVLRDKPESEISRNIRRATGGKTTETQQDACRPGLATDMRQFREKALAWQRLRHRLFRKYPAAWIHAWWYRQDPDTVAEKARKQQLPPTDVSLSAQPTPVGTQKTLARTDNPRQTPENRIG